MKSLQVALERGRRHQQVPAHQPGDRLGLGRGQPEARAQPLGDLRAQDRMIAAAPLGDVVQQHRDVQHAARDDAAEDAGGERMIVLQARRFSIRRAGRSRGSYARRRCNGGTCRTASARRRGRNRARSGRTRRPRSSSAAPSRDRAGLVSTSRNSALARGSRRRSSTSFASRAAARIASGWISSPCWSASANISISRTGSSPEEIVRRHRQPAAIEHEAVEPARRPAQRRQPEAPPARGELLVEMREEHARSDRRPSSPAGSNIA